MISVFKAAGRIASSAVLVLGSFSVAAWAEDTPSPAVLITDRGRSALLIVDPKDNHLVASIPVGKGPHEIAVSADGKLAMVAAFEQGNSISLIDLKAQKEIHRYEFPFPARPNSVAFVDGKFFFTAEAANSIGRYDPETRAVDFMIGVGQLTSHTLLYNPHDKAVIVASRGSDSVSFVEPVMIEYRGNKRLNWKVTTVPAVHFNEAMDVSPDGKELWVSEFQGGKIAILDLATRTVRERFEIANLKSDRLKFTPDGKRVLLSDLVSGELVVVDPTTHKEINRVKLGKGLEGLNITPDGSTLYAVTSPDNAVAIVDLKTMHDGSHSRSESAECCLDSVDVELDFTHEQTKFPHGHVRRTCNGASACSVTHTLPRLSGNAQRGKGTRYLLLPVRCKDRRVRRGLSGC